MYCANCGVALPPGRSACPSCGFTTTAPSPGPRPATPPDTVDGVIVETERAVRALAAATEHLSRKVAASADAFAKDASGSTRKGLERVKKEIHSAIDEISDALRKL